MDESTRGGELIRVARFVKGKETGTRIRNSREHREVMSELRVGREAIVNGHVVDAQPNVTTGTPKAVP